MMSLNVQYCVVFNRYVFLTVRLKSVLVITWFLLNLQEAHSCWVWLYHFGVDMITQMNQQLEILGAIDYPVSILQGKLDQGQPYRLFDGSATYSVKKSSTWSEYFLRIHPTHSPVCTYSPNGEVIGPTALDFFPHR
jgi:hypothetical protein